jgi:hypothetical protein
MTKNKNDCGVGMEQVSLLHPLKHCYEITERS